MIVAIILLVFAILILVEVPVAFSMGVAAMVGMLAKPELPFSIVSQRTILGINSFVYIAIPMFILAGSLMEHGGISRRLVVLAKALVGHFRGGLGMSVVVSEMFFSGISGSTVADVSAVSGMLLPGMKRAGYKPEYAVSIVSAASAMGILIPPCNLMVVLGAIANVSVAALFFAGFIPAFVLALVLMVTLFVQATQQGLPAEKRASWRRLGAALLDSLIALGMPVIIFGGILGGVATPTEAASLAVFYALIVTLFVYREIKPSRLPRILLDTTVVSGTVMLLIGLASILSYLFAVEQVPQAVAGGMVSMNVQPWLFLIISSLIFITLGSLLEGIPAALIFVPILLPVAELLHVDTLHFLIIVVAAMGIGTFLPPAGMGLLIACGIGQVSMTQAAGPMMVFVFVLSAGMLILIFVPWLTEVLPVTLLDYRVR
jgi:tripartite ATP-independent transporter DctM subunit